MEIFDHAVVDKDERAVAADVRVGIGFGGRAVRGPAGVADADVARGWRLGQFGGEGIDAPDAATDGETGAVMVRLTIHGRHARAVIAAVFEAS